MAPQPGLRERKKQRTRQLIADTAWRLFAQRGFDHVPVAEIASEAEVSEATVFNYFPTKEDLVFHRMQAFEQELLGAVEQRGEQESLVQAFGRFVLQARGALASDDPEATETMRTAARVITGSRSLLARERDILDSYTTTLAPSIARERGLAADDVEAWVVANALIGVHRVLIAQAHGQALAGVANRRIVASLRSTGRRALERLEQGLG